MRFNATLDRLEYNLVNGTTDPADEKLYQTYFTIKETPVRGKTYSYKEDVIRKAEKNFGYFALMSNGIKDPVESLRIYRLKDLIEKSFEQEDRGSLLVFSYSQLLRIFLII